MVDKKLVYNYVSQSSQKRFFKVKFWKVGLFLGIKIWPYSLHLPITDMWVEG